MRRETGVPDAQKGAQGTDCAAAYAHQRWAIIDAGA